MSSHYTVIESRVQAGGDVRYLVEGPGGVIVVQEDRAGNLSGHIRSGYVFGEEGDERAVARAVEAVRELRQDPDRGATEEAG